MVGCLHGFSKLNQSQAMYQMIPAIPKNKNVKKLEKRLTMAISSFEIWSLKLKRWVFEFEFAILNDLNASHLP